LAKCPHCEETEFTIEEVESPISMMFVVCVECDTIISSVENLNFDEWEVEMEENHNHFKKELNSIRDELKELRSIRGEMIDLQQDIQRKYNFIIELLERR
jgi:uncharacterized coiled-coil DUF342 family protein